MGHAQNMSTLIFSLMRYDPSLLFGFPMSKATAYCLLMSPKYHLNQTFICYCIITCLFGMLCSRIFVMGSRLSDEAGKYEPPLPRSHVLHEPDGVTVRGCVPQQGRVDRQVILVWRLRHQLVVHLRRKKESFLYVVVCYIPNVLCRVCVHKHNITVTILEGGKCV